MTSPQLEADVWRKLERDPRIAAFEDAMSVRGVYEVLDVLNVRLENHDRRLDDERRGAVAPDADLGFGASL